MNPPRGLETPPVQGRNTTTPSSDCSPDRWFQHLEDRIRQKDEELMAWNRARKRADEQIMRLNNDKGRMSEDYKEERIDLAGRIETLEEEASIRDEHIQMLEEELAKEHDPDGINGCPFLMDGLPAPGYPTGGTFSNREQEALNLIYQGQGFSEVCSGSDLTVKAIF
jgi:hypothetical protein